MSNSLFEKGAPVIVTERAGGRTFEITGKVKEMCGVRNVAIRTDDEKDRIVNVKHVRLAEPTPKKIQPPKNFEGAAVADIRDISVAMRGARNSRNITLELMATMLRCEASELSTIESGNLLPSDDLVLRLADVFNLPLDPLVQGLEHSRQKDARRRAEQVELERVAKEKAEQAQRAAVALKQADDERKKQEQMRARSFELFAEQLMDLVPVPLVIASRKQWYVFARALFELKAER